MATFDSAIQLARSEIGAHIPDTLLNRIAAQSADRVFRESFLWKERISITVTTNQNEQAWPVSATTDKRPFKLDNDSAYYDKQKITVIDDGVMQARLEQQQAQPGAPQYISLSVGDNLLNVYPQPATSGELVIYAFMTATDTTTSIPDAIEGKARDAIAWTMLSHLFMRPNETWTNPTLAEFYRVKAQQEISRLKRQVFMGGTKSKTLHGRRFIGSRLNTIRAR